MTPGGQLFAGAATALVLHPGSAASPEVRRLMSAMATGLAGLNGRRDASVMDLVAPAEALLAAHRRGENFNVAKGPLAVAVLAYFERYTAAAAEQMEADR